ncbi:putative membrane protein [Paenibacillus riograndensis SBR5]|uniref:Putative membrane protein n=1 Tax=Paenibacillus riograndensis SBR5 TaxID=1073571 RepID=A0A0E3WGB1_9BACL|nr:putative membrane protein [Paenibacillus riograndensis SBR5]
MKRKLASLLVVVSFALVLVISIPAAAGHSFVTFSEVHGG